jgi:hypothetical protein
MAIIICRIKLERVKHDVPVFNRPFSEVAAEYAQAQQRRANAGSGKSDYPRGAETVLVPSTNLAILPMHRWCTSIGNVAKRAWD